MINEMLQKLGIKSEFVRGKRVTDKATVQAVSYTHLRAHETVLDLVCRLLLEKKKTSITDVANVSETH